MGRTKIGWADFTINPFRARDTHTGKEGHWCLPTSPGCKNCYASKLQVRFHGHEFKLSNRDKLNLYFDQNAVDKVLTRKIPSIWFWCSMTDMFLDDYPEEWIDKCFAAMYEADQHVHMVLTKHPQRMREWSWNNKRIPCITKHAYDDWRRRNPDKGSLITYPDFVEDFKRKWPLPNVFMGVSVESPDYLWRIDELAKVRAAKRFISAEPLLAPLDLQMYLGLKPQENGFWDKVSDKPILDYVIGGGESGMFARRCPPSAPRLLRDQCKEAAVPFQWKNWGTWVPYRDISEQILRTESLGSKQSLNDFGETYYKFDKMKAGAFLDGVEHMAMATEAME